LPVPAQLGRLLKIKLQRPLQGTPVTAHRVLRADGHWYALIVCEPTPHDAFSAAQPAEDECAQPAIGLDVGLRVFLAVAEGGMLENPRHYRLSQKHLAQGQRTVCRRTKGSRRRRKAGRAVARQHLMIARQHLMIARQHLMIARQRRDFHCKTATQYAMRYCRICVEAVNVSGMVHTQHLAKSIHDASWSALLGSLEDKAERAGHHVLRVPARYTTPRSAAAAGVASTSKKASRDGRICAPPVGWSTTATCMPPETAYRRGHRLQGREPMGARLN
jgi:putative transposase